MNFSFSGKVNASLYYRQKAVEDANRDIRQLEERLKSAEQEKAAVESVRRHLEDEIRRMKS